MTAVDVRGMVATDPVMTLRDGKELSTFRLCVNVTENGDTRTDWYWVAALGLGAFDAVAFSRGARVHVVGTDAVTPQGDAVIVASSIARDRVFAAAVRA